jgi:multisubunit Na+/H+ antiporter MnhC subunit
MMKVVVQIIAILLLISGLYVMFSSSMVGGGISGLIGFPLFVVGLILVLLPILRRHNGNSRH